MTFCPVFFKGFANVIGSERQMKLKRRFRISLFRLLVLFTVAGIVLAMIGQRNFRSMQLHLHEWYDSDMQFVAMLHDLEFLSISNSGVGNRGIECVEPLPKLKTLKLGTTKITRSGSEGLKKRIQSARSGGSETGFVIETNGHCL